MFLKKRLQRRKEKKLKRDEKWSDPYNIKYMSKDEFLSKKKKLVRGSISRIILGIVLLCALIITLILAWDELFWSSDRWWF